MSEFHDQKKKKKKKAISVLEKNINFQMTLHCRKNRNLQYLVCHPLSSPEGSCQNSMTESTLDIESCLIQQGLHLLHRLHHFSMELIHLPVNRKHFVLHRRRYSFAFPLHFTLMCLRAFSVVFLTADAHAVFCHVISSFLVTI